MTIVIERISSYRFLEAFLAWGDEISQLLTWQICIDGKSLKIFICKSALHLVSAFCTENRIVIESVNTGRKRKENLAIKIYSKVGKNFKFLIIN